MTSRILTNDTEISYSRKVGLQNHLDLTEVPLIKRVSQKNRMKLTRKNVDLFVNEINGFLGKNPNSKVFHITQFNKGDIKSNEEFNFINKIQLNSELETFVLQEFSKNHSLKEFAHIVEKYKDVNREKFLLIEVESKDVEDKIKLAILKGFDNFIIRGGKYSDTVKWIEIRGIIRQGEGRFIISLPKRMDRNRASYIKYALSYGCDHTFHEKPTPFPVINSNVLNLDSNFNYVRMFFSREYGIEINDENLYDFSRVRTILQAERLAVQLPVL